MRVCFLSPAFPAEMPRFVEGLAAAGARVVGVGDQPAGLLPELTRRCLHDYVQVRSMWDAAEIAAALGASANRDSIDRVECLWEPGVLLAAELREAMDLPGMRVERATAFRDKERMKQRLDEAGIRTPRHAKASRVSEVREAAERIGYPLIVKPIAGAGSADTHRVEDASDLERVIPALGHVDEVSVEEYIEGEEFTFDTLCAGGEIRFFNVSWYRPRPLIARSVEWTSPQTVSLRDPARFGHLKSGIDMGHRVIEALGFEAGFTHMEWFLTESGEAVFGEIAARPPGAVSVDIMNVSSGIDTFRAWGELVVSGRMQQSPSWRFNAAVIFKRARGRGRIVGVEGLERLVARFRESIVEIDLLSPGMPRRNWKQTLLSDGHLIVRHPDLQATLEIADRIGTDLRMYASS